jgi:hypothetical protein
MSHKKKNAVSKFLGVFFVFAFFIGLCAMVLAGAYWLYRKACEKQAVEVKLEIEALPVFSEGAAAAEKGWDYPPLPPAKTAEEIKKQIHSAIKEKVDARYPKSGLQKKIFEISAKYVDAKIGDKVKFQKNNSTKTMTEGVFYGRDGRFVKIDDNKIMLSDIQDEYHYLFDSSLAEKIARDEIEEFKQEGKTLAEETAAQIDIEEQERLYPQSGYTRQNGIWRPNDEIVNEYVQRRKAEFESEREETITAIINRHKILGIIKVQLEKGKTVERENITN